MTHRTRLLILAASVFTLTSVSRGEAAERSPCTDNCYYRYYWYCAGMSDPSRRADCMSDYFTCLNACPAEE